jgi:hypothetical protein
MGRTVVVLQPGYLPWLGFFDQMARADIFVYYDDVQFDKNGWRNRNRIKTARGARWLTVPVLQSGRGLQRICSVEIDNRTPWRRKHIETIGQAYAKAAYTKEYAPVLEQLLSGTWENLADLDIAATDLMARWLGISTATYRSSRLGIEGGQSERLMAICRNFGADRYLSGASARTYLDVPLFERHGIEVEWQDYDHPVYAQQHGEFVSHLSALDLVLNMGPSSRDILLRTPRAAQARQAEA